MQRKRFVRKPIWFALAIAICIVAFVIIMTTLSADAATTYTLRGTWKWNDTVSGYDFGGSGYLGPNDCTEFEVEFTSNGNEYHNLGYLYQSSGARSKVELLYRYLKLGGDRVYEDEAWNDEAYKIVDFGIEPQEVSEDFYNWFTANASPVTVMVMFDGNGGKHYSSTVNDYTMGTISMNLQVGTYYTFPEKNPARANYSFSGWYTASDGGTRVTSSTEVTETSTHRLYAHWSGNLSPQSKIGDF